MKPLSAPFESEIMSNETETEIVFITLSVKTTLQKWSLLVPSLWFTNKSTCIGEIVLLSLKKKKRWLYSELSR